MKRARHKLLLASLLLWAAPWLLARPLDTDDTGTVAKGQWEMEGGLDFTRAAGANSWAYTPVLAYGLTDRLQVELGCDYLVEHGDVDEAAAHGLDPLLQLKSRCWSTADGRFSLALAGNLGWPARLRGPREGWERHGEVRLLATQEFGEAALDFNAGYEFTGAWGGGDDAGLVSAGFRRPVTSTLGWVGEVFATFPRQASMQTLVATGLTVQGRGGWTFDALVGCGVGTESPDVRFVLGFVRAL